MTDNGKQTALVLYTGDNTVADTKKKSGEPQEKYALPARYANQGFLDTETQLWPDETTGLAHIADGRMWEIKSHAVKALKKSGIEPHGYIDHGPQEKVPIWRVDEGGEHWLQNTAGVVSPAVNYYVNACVYDAVAKYIEKLGLGGLTGGDKDWFKYHPNVTTDGASRATVLGVVHGLLYPYGLGISRVYMPKASSLGDEHKVFAKALGMNPAAMATYSISNIEFIESLGEDVDPLVSSGIIDGCRFEFVDEPESPCVALVNQTTTTFKKDKKKTGGKNVGGAWSSTSAGMGHADYLGARDETYGTWLIAFKLDRLNSIPYQDAGLLSALDIDVSKSKKKKLKTRKDKKSAQQQELSIYQSKFGGVPITDVNSAHKKVLSTKKKTPTNGPHATTQDAVVKVAAEIPDGKLITGNDRDVVSLSIDDDCPHCGKRDLEILGDYTFCATCGAWSDNDGKTWDGMAEPGSDDNLCPICGSSVVDGYCISCMYSTDHWAESRYTMCPIHGTAPYVSSNSVFICPGCLIDEGLNPLDFYMSGESMVSKMTHLAT